MQKLLVVVRHGKALPLLGNAQNHYSGALGGLETTVLERKSKKVIQSLAQRERKEVGDLGTVILGGV